MNPVKALAYLTYPYRQWTLKHIGTGTTERRVVLDRETVLSHKIPIQGTAETVDLLSVSTYTYFRWENILGYYLQQQVTVSI